VHRLVFTHAAQTNLLEIAEYIENASGNLATAERFTNELVARCEHLAELPGILGRPRPELLPNLRSTPHGNYVIFFRYVDDALEVVNILEGHRDIATHFKSSDE
jgi:plasmid stabilization system protein ParE